MYPQLLVAFKLGKVPLKKMSPNCSDKDLELSWIVVWACLQ